VIGRGSLVCSLLLFTTSCGVYRSSFDCPPGKGVPCASVSEIESMIVETNHGPDLFLPDLGSEDGELGLFGWIKQRRPTHRGPFRIWVEPMRTADGHVIHGHYMEERPSCSHY